MNPKIESQENPQAKPILTSFCFSDVHNCFSMLEPPYVLRKSATLAIDTLLATKGQVDVVMMGGDYMSDYPGWLNCSNTLPYTYYLGYKEATVKEYARLAKDGKVLYCAGNHDFAQGEAATDGPGKNGSYNSFEFYYTGPMNQTPGPLPDSERFEIVGEHTGEKYLLCYHYEIRGVHFLALSPDPDQIWNTQCVGFHPDSLTWLKNKLEEIDPDGKEVIFLSCHYAMDQRDARSENVNEGFHHDDFIAGTIGSLLLGHRNLFYMYGHWTCAHSFHKGTTVKNVIHYYKDQSIIPIEGDELSSREVKDAEKRSFSSVWMGGFRLDHNGNQEYFEDDPVEGWGGYTDKKRKFPSTATPKMSQGMYIDVFPDRVVFTMMNFGNYPGYETETPIAPYTVYRND